MLTFQEYKLYFEANHRFPDKSYVRPKGYNDAQLVSKYQKYEKSQTRKQEKTVTRKGTSQDIRWTSTKKELWDKKGRTCVLCSILTEEESQLLVINDIFNLKTIDPAHVLGKGAFPKAYYYEKNLVPLNRYSHSMLDQQKCPLTGKTISKKEWVHWWNRILKVYGLSYQLMIDWYTEEVVDG